MTTPATPANHGAAANDVASPTTAASTDHRRTDLVGLPLGPASLSWRLLGDTRSLLLIGRTGVLQNMHPAVSQALVEHSRYFDDPIGRISRSAGPILGVVYDEDGVGTAKDVRDWHQPIRSKAGAEHRYRALDPSVFYWTHATFVEAAIETQRVFGTPLSRSELERFYRESITWWRRYGMSMAPVPENYEAFRRYWDDMFASQLQATPVAVGAIKATTMPVPPPGMPPQLWRIAGERAAVFGATWITKAALPPAAREILGIRWTRHDERLAQAYFRAVRVGWKGVPAKARRMPRAAAADRRLAAAEAAAGHAAAAA